MYAIVDCNNFYVSCERLFRPDLKDKAIIVLSNNDGCVISRSNEAKALGILMGEPYFHIKDLCTKKGVYVFSSNFALYGNLSDRVMCTMENFWPHIEIYSIDEAFLDLKTLANNLHNNFAHTLHKTILQHTGIPVSIGLGQTKTLAKLANHVCKKMLQVPVFNIAERPDLLTKIPIDEIWGIGKAFALQLNKLKIFTAFDLAQTKIRKLPLPIQRTILELNGISALQFSEDTAKPKSIMASRSFKSEQGDLFSLKQALAAHCQTAYAKLRQHDLVTQQVQVFVRTNPFKKQHVQYANRAQYALPNPTDNLINLTSIANKLLDSLYKPNVAYKKIGICLTDFYSKENYQFQLLKPSTQEEDAKNNRWSNILDSINKKFGRHTLRLATSIPPKTNKPPTYNLSQAYTTRWQDLPRVK